MPDDMTGSMPPPAPPPSSGEPTQDDRTMAMLSWILGAFTFVVPLVFYLVKKDQSRFVAYHSLQALFLGLVYGVSVALTCGILVVIWPGWIAVCIIWGLKAKDGKWDDFPMVGEWARKCL